MAANAQNDPLDLVGTVLDGKFRVESAVAEGGFGLVYRATHLTLDRPVALKILKHDQSAAGAGADFLEGFAREARTIARLSHPHIVQVLDFGVSEMPHGELSMWMALEWIVGETLEQALARPSRAGGMPPSEVMQWMRGALEALAYAHDEGVAHRDVKPSNFILVKGKRGETLRLLDFGIAKIMGDRFNVGTGETETQSEQVSCSPRYAAPEQFGRGRTGPWTDVHALGLVLTQMLTGRLPYRSDNIATLCFDALRPERPTPGLFGVDVGAWEPVLLRALAVRTPERYENAGALLAALDEALPDATHVRGSPSPDALATDDEVLPLASVSARAAPGVTAPGVTASGVTASGKRDPSRALSLGVAVVACAVVAYVIVVLGTTAPNPASPSRVAAASTPPAASAPHPEIAPETRITVTDPAILTDAASRAGAPAEVALRPNVVRLPHAGLHFAHAGDASAAPGVQTPAAVVPVVVIPATDAGRLRYRVE